MKVRTKKLLSILLAASMVFSLNITAMGAQPEEEVESPVVILTTGENAREEGQTDGYLDGYEKGYNDGLNRGIYDCTWMIPEGQTQDYADGYNEGFPSGYRFGFEEGYQERTRYGVDLPTSRTQIKELDYDVIQDATKVDLTGDAVKITGLSVNKLTDLRETLEGKTVIQTILSASKPGEDTYLVNKKDISVSGDYTNAYDIDGMVSSRRDAYYDVVELEGGNALFLEYHSSSWDLGWVSGVEDPIPVMEYTGQSIEFQNPKKKDNKGKNYDLCVDAALVKFENGTIEEIPGVTVAGGKIDKKNAKDASVSGESIKVKASRKSNGFEFKDAEFDEYVKAGNAKEIPTFTVKIKAADAAKSSKKAITTALKDKKYQFAISQQVVTLWDPNGSTPNRSADGTLSYNDVARYVGNVDQTTVGASDIVVSKYNGKKATVTSEVWDDDDVKVLGYAKLKAGKDYTLEKGTLGESNTEVAYIKEFLGNYMYSNKNGIYSDGYMFAFRQSPVDKKLLRRGVFKADGDGFVYSED